MEKLLFLGDLFYDYDRVENDIEKLSEWISQNNYVTVLNMEGGITQAGSFPIKKRGPNLASSERIIDVLKQLNVKGVCLANNHTMDFGGEAVARTIDLLEQNGIAHCGWGNNLENAVRPMRICINDTVYSIFSFGWDVEETVYATDTVPGCAPRDEKIILNAVQQEIKNNKHVAVNLHWGFEYNRLPMPYDVAFAHQLIETGVELIIGHHPHCVQPKEDYLGKKIYYSLGNFYFSGRRDRYKKVFPDKIPNQSDYGLLVAVNGKEYSEFLIRYDKLKKESLLMDANDDILEDLTGTDYTSKEYYKQVRRRKVNSNPILTDNMLLNKIKLRLLFISYGIKKVIKKVLFIK